MSHSPDPCHAPIAWRWPVAILSAGAAAIVSCWWLGFQPLQLLSESTLHALGDLARSSWPPDLDVRLLRRVLRAAGETLVLSVAGTFLAALIGLVLAPLMADAGSRTWRRDDAGRWRRMVAMGARLLANLLRTTPYLVVALVAIFVCGLGPAAGVIAIGLHTGGILARLYAIALDAVDPGPLQGLHAAGARPWQILLFGTLPAARPALAAYTLYRWEMNIRESAILGLVGCGGLGFEILRALGQFDRPALTTLVLATLLLSIAVDAGSSWLRRHLV